MSAASGGLVGTPPGPATVHGSTTCACDQEVRHARRARCVRDEHARLDGAPRFGYRIRAGGFRIVRPASVFHGRTDPTAQ